MSRYNIDMLTEHDLTFCPKCGNEFGKRWSNLLICSRCDFHYYINPRPTCGILFENEKGQILLAKRKYPPKKGFYDTPGGFVDIGETGEESIRREVMEELGIKIKNMKYLGSYTSRYAFKGLKFYTLASTYYAPFPQDQKLTISSDISGVTFFDKDKIPWDKIAFEAVTTALKDYVKLYS